MIQFLKTAVTWALLIFGWILLLPVYLAIWLWQAVTGRRLFFGR